MKKKILLGVLAIISLFTITGCGVKIKKSETSQMAYEDFNNGYLKMQIPKG